MLCSLGERGVYVIALMASLAEDAVKLVSSYFFIGLRSVYDRPKTGVSRFLSATRVGATETKETGR